MDARGETISATILICDWEWRINERIEMLSALLSHMHGFGHNHHASSHFLCSSYLNKIAQSTGIFRSLFEYLAERHDYWSALIREVLLPSSDIDVCPYVLFLQLNNIRGTRLICQIKNRNLDPYDAARKLVRKSLVVSQLPICSRIWLYCDSSIEPLSRSISQICEIVVNE